MDGCVYKFQLSLPMRAWLAVTVIALLAITTTVTSGLLSWESEGDARAINTAGSIRMAIYRFNNEWLREFSHAQFSADEKSWLNQQYAQHTLTSTYPDGISLDDSKAFQQLLIEDMDHRLTELAVYQSNKSSDQDESQQMFDDIQKHWHQVLKPMIFAQRKDDFYLSSIHYVVMVDDYVVKLQSLNEKRLGHLQSIHAFSLIITMIVMFTGMLQLQKNILNPIKNLIDANRVFRDDQKIRVHIKGYKEFEDLADSFNAMADTIETNQRHLNNEVISKTKDLTRANAALSILYEFGQQMSTRPVKLETLNKLIEQYASLMPNYHLVLCLQYDIHAEKDNISLHRGGTQDICKKINCQECYLKNDANTRRYTVAHLGETFGELQVQQVLPKENAKHHINSVSLSKDGVVESVPTWLDISPAENDLFETLTHFISTALSLRQQRQQQHQILLLEERTTIARELHDSLAQSLSYLKIQVSMLERKMDLDDLKTKQVIDHVKKGLDDAYRQLRELLVTFRLKIDGDNFDHALQMSADDFAQRAGFHVHINNRVMSINLEANEQIDLLQIAREALSNIHRHAKATHVMIDLGYIKSENKVIMQITDDGVGMNDDKIDQSQHHGLMIMHERVRNLNGKLTISANQPHGVIVKVEFLPAFFIKR